MPTPLGLFQLWSLASRHGQGCTGVFQELTAEAGKEVRIRRNDGGANEKLEQQENLLLKAKIAHARQLLQHNADHSLDLLR